jgi:hypothetical protein
MGRIGGDGWISTLGQKAIELRREMGIIFRWCFIARWALLRLWRGRLGVGSGNGESSQLGGIDRVRLGLPWGVSCRRREIVIESQNTLIVRAIVVIVVVMKFLDRRELRWAG